MKVNVELLRLSWTYAIASVVIVGGFVFLWRAMELSTEKRDQLILGAVIALISAASSFVFGEAVATRSARQSERATQQGLDTPVTPA